MKRLSGFIGIFISILIVISAITLVAASSSPIDTATSSEGYFTVNYTDGTDTKAKIGITYGGDTTYYNYTLGSSSRYSFTQGDGKYTITIYLNVSGISYREVSSKSINVTLNNQNSKYLISTAEITFSDTDSVGLKAAELCKNKKSVSDKVIAIYNYIASNFSYDSALAAKITSGEISGYTPNTADVLASKIGICYDFSALFAAMCRSEEIPCIIVRGTYNGTSHAWNAVYVDNDWYTIDLTYSISNKVYNVRSITSCITPLNYIESDNNIELSKIVIPTSKKAENNTTYFTDVAPDAWYAPYVSKINSLGLVNGTTATTFDPTSNIKISEAIKIVACLYSNYNNDGETFSAYGEKWYTAYVDYASKNGILTNFENYENNATRSQFAQILESALPANSFSPINDIPYGAIYDVPMSSSYASSIYLLCRAGIITGDTNGAFNPDNRITRSEVAAIVVRALDKSYRVSI